MKRWLAIVAFAIFGLWLVRGDEIDVSKLPPSAKAQVEFNRDIRPLLEARCVKCHGGAKPKGKFSL